MWAHTCVSACGGRERASVPREWSFRQLWATQSRCWDSNLCLLEKQQVSMCSSALSHLSSPVTRCFSFISAFFNHSRHCFPLLPSFLLFVCTTLPLLTRCFSYAIFPSLWCVWGFSIRFVLDVLLFLRFAFFWVVLGIEPSKNDCSPI